MLQVSADGAISSQFLPLADARGWWAVVQPSCLALLAAELVWRRKRGKAGCCGGKKVVSLGGSFWFQVYTAPAETGGSSVAPLVPSVLGLPAPGTSSPCWHEAALAQELGPAAALVDFW